MSATNCPCCGHTLMNDGSIRFDVESGFVVTGGQVAALTKHESEVFHALWEAQPRILSTANLIEKLYWRGSIDEEPEPKIIDVYICKIRRKMAGMPIKIQTAWGRGYFIATQPKEKAA